GHQQGIDDVLLQQPAQQCLDGRYNAVGRFDGRVNHSSSFLRSVRRKTQNVRIAYFVLRIPFQRATYVLRYIAPTPFNGLGPFAFSAATKSVTVSAKYWPSEALIQRSQTRSGSRPICCSIVC